ncbi:MAG: hypothetical protein JNJ61_08005 [Anaerolineae bacterium]|nr:hypothetical protein [Anaerolineae bacterium]
MKWVVIALTFALLVLLYTEANTQAISVPGCEVILEQLSAHLYLDTTAVPDQFDQDTLIRLFDFLEEHVVADCRTPFGEQAGALPVIVRYVAEDVEGEFPAASEGFAGLCDVVAVKCRLPLDGRCGVSLPGQDRDTTTAFLALITMPDMNEPDYQVQLWGFTAHELAHSFGAVDGPRCPFYEDDDLAAPIKAVSDTYYWFGRTHVFEAGYRGIVWDVWQSACGDSLCESLREEVFSSVGAPGFEPGT